jgi:hypothetical protein
MSGPPASNPYNPGDEYFISPRLKGELRKGITKEEVAKLYAAQEALIGKRRQCLTSPQLAMSTVLQSHEDFMVGAKGTVSALQQLKKGMSPYVDSKTPGMVRETCGFVQVYKGWSDEFSKSAQGVDTVALQSLLSKLDELKKLKKGDAYPDLEITPGEISTLAKVCELGNKMCNEMPRPVSASQDELKKLENGVQYIVTMLNGAEKHSKKPYLLSPGEVVELHGASDSVPSRQAKNEYINALREAGLSDEKIKELTRFSDDQFQKISESSSKRPAGDEPAGAGATKKKTLASSVKGAPPAAAVAAAGPAPAGSPAAAAPAPAGSPAAAAPAPAVSPAAAAPAPAGSPAAAARPTGGRRGTGETRRDPEALKSALEAMKPEDEAK